MKSKHGVNQEIFLHSNNIEKSSEASQIFNMYRIINCNHFDLSTHWTVILHKYKHVYPDSGLN